MMVVVDVNEAFASVDRGRVVNQTVVTGISQMGV